MNKHNWYYKQQVTEGDLDEAFDDVEDAIRLTTTDNQLVGVAAGGDLVPANPENLTVIIETPVIAYDDQGRRIFIASHAPIDISVDSNLVSTAVSDPLNMKIVSIFIEFDVTLSNPKTDGNSQEVFYDISESFNIIVEQSAEAANPTPPALQAGKLLLGDIRRTHEQTQVTAGDISMERQQVTFRLASSNMIVEAGTLAGVTGAMLQILDDHIAELGSAHSAAAIGYTDSSGGWADSSNLLATNVQDALDEIVDTLGDTSGSLFVGFDPSTSKHTATNVQDALAACGVLAGDNAWEGLNFFCQLEFASHTNTEPWQGEFKEQHRTFAKTITVENGGYQMPITSAVSSQELFGPPASNAAIIEVDSRIFNCAESVADSYMAAWIRAIVVYSGGTYNVVSNDVVFKVGQGLKIVDEPVVENVGGQLSIHWLYEAVGLGSTAHIAAVVKMRVFPTP